MAITPITDALKNVWVRATGTNQDVTRHTTEAFENRARLPAQTIFKILAHGVPVPEIVVIDQPSLHKPWLFSMVMRGDDYTSSCNFNFKENVIEPGWMENLSRNRGTGRRLLADRAMAGIALGFDELRIHASSMMGGYVWARAGVYPEKNEYDDLVESMRERLAALKKFMPKDLYATAYELCGLTTPQDLVRIAHLEQKFKNASEIFDEIRDIDDDDDDESFESYRDQGYFPGGIMTLGQYLLVDQHYHSFVKLSDAGQMKRFEAYAGVAIRDEVAKLILPPASQSDATQPTQSAARLSIPASQTAPPL